MDRAIEYQRRVVVLCRKHGVGNDAITGKKPNKRPLLDWTLGWFDKNKPEFVRELESLKAEFRDVFAPVNLVSLAGDQTFTEAELAE